MKTLGGKTLLAPGVRDAERQVESLSVSHRATAEGRSPKPCPSCLGEVCRLSKVEGPDATKPQTGAT